MDPLSYLVSLLLASQAMDQSNQLLRNPCSTSAQLELSDRLYDLVLALDAERRESDADEHQHCTDVWKDEMKDGDLR